MIVMDRTKRIFNRDIAMALVYKGFKVIKTQVHKDNPNWIIYHFIDTEELRREFTAITNMIKNNK